MKRSRIIIGILLVAILGMSASLTSNRHNRFREHRIEVEEWMTEPFMFIEEPLEVEDWMTKPFATNDKA